MKNVSGLSWLCAVVASLAMTSTASASILGTSSAPVGSETGTFSAIATVSGVFSTGDVTGTLIEQVGTYSANPLSSPGLSFLYTFIANPNLSLHGIGAISVADYTGFTVDAATYNSSSPSNTQGSINFGIVNLSFDVVAGGSASFILNTQAPRFTLGTWSLQDQGSTGALTGYLAPTIGPNVRLPEPASMALCLSGLLTFAGGFASRKLRQRRQV